MANYNTSKVTTDNPEILASIIERTELGVIHINLNNEIKVNEFHDVIEFSEDQKQVVIQTRNGTFHDVLIQLSKRWEDQIIRCEFEFEHNYGTEREIVQYKNGEYDNIETLCYPLVNCISHLTDEETEDLMQNKVFIIANAIDKGDQVTIEFSKGKYKIVTTFNRFSGEAKVYFKTDDWVEKKYGVAPLLNTPCESIDDLPF